MTLRHLSSVLLGLALGLPAAGTASAASAASAPWDDVWTMDLKDEERTYVDLEDTSYLMIQPEELGDQLFVKGKDVAINLKFATLDRNSAAFYRAETLTVIGGEEHWARALDGDNLYLLGEVGFSDQGTPIITIDHVVPAPSDAEIIAGKLDELAANDYAGRLALAKWARGQSETLGNQAWWLQAAADIVTQTVRSAAAVAAEQKDLGLLVEAMGWAIEDGHNRELAAELGSQSWVFASTNPMAAKVGEKMQAMGYVLSGEGDERRWMTQGEALTSQYQARMDTMHWRDAEGYFQLGRWADQHADVLPHARELAHQAYLKGQQADPRHAGIRRELGLPPVAPDTAKAGYALDFNSPEGVAVKAPQGWDRTAKPVSAGADVTWIDPRSDTAFLAVSVVDHETRPTMAVVWNLQIEQLQVRPGFQPGPVESSNGGRIRRMKYRSQAGDEVRPAELVLLYNPTTGYGVSLMVSYVEQESEAVLAALEAAIDSVELPERPEPEVPESPESGAAPTPPAAP